MFKRLKLLFKASARLVRVRSVTLRVRVRVSVSHVAPFQRLTSELHPFFVSLRDAHFLRTVYLRGFRLKLYQPKYNYPLSLNFDWEDHFQF